MMPTIPILRPVPGFSRPLDVHLFLAHTSLFPTAAMNERTLLVGAHVWMSICFSRLGAKPMGLLPPNGITAQSIDSPHPIVGITEAHGQDHLDSRSPAELSGFS